MQVGLLGPLRIETAAGPRALGAASCRRAFIYLALHANRVVTTDRLARAVWGDDAPRPAERAVHSLVYRLRQQLGDLPSEDVPVVRREPGYALEIDDRDIDLHVFEERLDAAYDLVDEAPAAARDRFEDAFELWRGEPFMDVAYEAWVLAEARRLCERYVAAREAAARCDLVGGHAERAIADLQGLTVSYPLRESLWELLWQALATAGRYSEIVASHRRCVRTLRDEYDIVEVVHLDDLAHELAVPGPSD